MVKRTVLGSQRTIASIDGFDEPIESAKRGATIGTIEPATRIEEPQNVAGLPTVEPFDLIDGGISGDGFPSGRKRRGRPVGSRNAPKQASTQNIAEHLESLLLSVHLMGAAFFSTPELALDPEEATKLSDAIKNVAQYYPVVFDPKKLAMGNLGIVLLTIYGTRGVTLWKKMKQETPSKSKPAPTPIRSESPKSPGTSGPPAPSASAPPANNRASDVPIDFRVHTTIGVNDEHNFDV
jgi:hypothetical protein